MTVTLALGGDAIVTRRFGRVDRDDVTAMLSPFETADCGLLHLEGTVCDRADEAVVPSAEAGGTWLRGPPGVATDLANAGVDVVTHASNHALDFGRGGLAATHEYLALAGVAVAGTGSTLADARLPTYCEVAGARIGVVSASTAFQPAARAGEQRRDVRGRPGVNPLRTHFEVGPNRLAQVRDLAKATGQWIVPGNGEILVHPPGLHNSVTRYVERDEPGIERVLDERDRAGNVRAIEEADRQADVAIAHVHTHAWARDGDLSDPPAFVREFARECVDAGADVVLCQGSHAPLRGMERYAGALICYDPGTLFDTAESSERLPADFYERYAPDLDASATPGEALASRGLGELGEDESEAAYGSAVENPPGGYFSGDVVGTVVVECTFDGDLDLERVELLPGELLDGRRSHDGLPARVAGARAADLLEYVDELSTPFDTRVDVEDGRGTVQPA